MIVVDGKGNELLDIIHDIEAEAGRERIIHWGPRTLDIDILLFDDVIMNTETLTIPHPEMHKREFVLKPLNEIAPYAYHPIYKKTVEELYARLRRKLEHEAEPYDTDDYTEVEELTPVEEETATERMSRGFGESMKKVKNGFVDFGVAFVVNLPFIIVFLGITIAIIMIVLGIVKFCMNGEERKKRKALKKEKKAMKKNEKNDDATIK